MARLKSGNRSERINEKLKSVIDLYNLSFQGLSSDILNLEKFKLDLKFLPDGKILIKNDAYIYKQIRTCEDLRLLYPKDETFKELKGRLIQVHKQLLKIIKDEYGVDSCWIDDISKLEKTL